MLAVSSDQGPYVQFPLPSPPYSLGEDRGQDDDEEDQDDDKEGQDDNDEEGHEVVEQRELNPTKEIPDEMHCELSDISDKLIIDNKSSKIQICLKHHHVQRKKQNGRPNHNQASEENTVPCIHPRDPLGNTPRGKLRKRENNKLSLGKFKTNYIYII